MITIDVMRSFINILMTFSFFVCVDCATKETGTENVLQRSDQVDATVGVSNHEVMSVPSVETVQAVNSVISSRCPVGMRYVTGWLCKKVRYKCVRGRNRRAGMVCPHGCYVPFDDCQEWMPGSAECLPTKTVGRIGSRAVVYEPEWIPFEFCMDEHEWPNRIGEKPAVFITYHDAEKMCQSVGKRICTSAEFTLACEGSKQLPTGYGWKIDGTVCNVDRKWRDWTRVRIRTPEGFKAIDQREAIGSRPECVSSYGVYDLTGNVDEWTQLDPIDRGMSSYSSQLKGGYYAYGANPYCRAHTDVHGPEFSFYQIGTRCCSNVVISSK